MRWWSHMAALLTGKTRVLFFPLVSFLADEVSAIVIDVGYTNCKAGFAGEDNPKAVFPSVRSRFAAPFPWAFIETLICFPST